MEIFITSVRITEEICVIGHLKYGLREKFYRPPNPVQVPCQYFLHVVQDIRMWSVLQFLVCYDSPVAAAEKESRTPSYFGRCTRSASSNLSAPLGSHHSQRGQQPILADGAHGKAGIWHLHQSWAVHVLPGG